MFDIIFSFIRYLKIFQKYTRGGIYLSFFLTVLAGLSEGIGIYLLLPIVQSTNGNINSNNVGISKFIFSFLNSLNISQSYGVILFLIVLAFIAKGLLIFFTYSYNSFLRGRLIYDLKKKIFTGFEKMSYQYFLENKIGDLTNILNEQINLSVRGFNSLYTVGLRAINCLIYLIFACALSGITGLIAILGSFIILFIFKWLNKATKRMSIKTANENSNLANITIESLQNFKYLKSTNKFKIKTQEAGRSIKELSSYQTKTGILEGFTSASREPIAVIVIMIILFIQMVVLNKPIDTLVVSLILFYRGLISTLGVQGNWQNTQVYLGSFEMVLKKIDSLFRNIESNGLTKINSFKIIKFSNVYFKFFRKDEYALKGINLSIEAKKSIALVGKSGAGKSTIANLICSILKASKGNIKIDKYDISEINLNLWRDKIGYVSQEMAIFDNTIEYNISLSENINNLEIKKKITEAAEKANIKEFIESLPNQYKTKVGEQGLRLSGGQKQRLFIAREIYKNPEILILDEATSALDTVSEKAIKKSIELLKGRITLIIIAHRISTIKDCDYLYVINKGNLIEEGTFRQLSEQDNSFFNYLISSQKI